MTSINKQAAVIRAQMKAYWGARKLLAERLNTSESTIRRHLMDGSKTSKNVRLKTMSEAVKMLKELEADNNNKIKKIMSVTANASTDGNTE